jgi:3-phenylpropionate/trans-cinnamate dioxygenase ferredoxin reductase component
MTSPRSDSSVQRVVVVGTGDCGARVALGLREHGFEGDVVLVGDETDAPYERPALSKAVLALESENPNPIASAGQLADLGITWHSGTKAVSIDRALRRLELDTGDAIAYDRLVLATGARARRSPVPGAEIAHSLRSFRDAVTLREQLFEGARLLIIGGGFVGLEAAATAIERGCAVTVVEFAQTLMSRVVPNSVAELIQARHLAAGCDLRLGIGVENLERIDDGFTAVFSDGSRQQFDVGLVGIGAIPNTELAATAKLSITNGVAVDDRLRTSDPDIFAAGDCCSIPHPLYNGARLRIEAWQNAVTQAEVVAENVLGGDRVYDAVPLFWSDQYDLRLQIVGLHSFAVREVTRRRADGAELLFGLDSTGRVISASGVAPGTAIARDMSAAGAIIAGRTPMHPADLSDASVDLRSLASSRHRSSNAELISAAD